jgi:hypothetical protein
MIARLPEYHEWVPCPRWRCLLAADCAAVASCFAHTGSVPTSGTTVVVPSGLRGRIYYERHLTLFFRDVFCPSGRQSRRDWAGLRACVGLPDNR